MNIGTKSLLFGAHQVIIHPVFVLIAWIKLYRSFPNWQELICIIIHDWGYWGKPNMDGEEGEGHPIWAGYWVRTYFRRKEAVYYQNLCWFHSRFLAKRYNTKPSKLCLPDKLGVALMPAWLWIGLCNLTGELDEYKSKLKYEINRDSIVRTDKEYFAAYREIVKTWVKYGIW